MALDLPGGNGDNDGRKGRLEVMVVQGIKDFGKFRCNALDGVKVAHLYVLLSFDG